MDKSSKTRFGQEYQLLRRIANEIGKNGWRIIGLAQQGDQTSIEKIQRLAFKGRKRPAVLRLVESLMQNRERLNAKPATKRTSNKPHIAD